MSRKKTALPSNETPILAYTSVSERSVNLPESVMKTFESYASFFQEKAGYDLSAGDVIAAKGNELFSHPDKIEVPKVEKKIEEKLTLPNSAWAGIDHAAKYHASSQEMVLEILANTLGKDEGFQRWKKKQARDSKRKTAH